MTSFAGGRGSTCLVGVLVYGLLATCLCPGAMFLGGFASTLQADRVAQLMEPLLCPPNSTAEIVTFQTSMRTSNGGDVPATGFEMQCVDRGGRIVRGPSPDYAMYWLGLLALGSLAIAGVLALLLARPLSSHITAALRRFQRSSLS